jgi:hypothetical protein
MKGLLPILSVFLLLSPRLAFAEDAQGIEFFEKKIRPVLVEHCYSCHSEQNKKSKGGLTLDTKAGLVNGGDTGPVLNRDKPRDGLLIKALRYDGDVQMPPKEKLPDAVIQDFVKWVEMGAPDPRDGKKVVTSGINWSEARQFWSFQPVVRSPLPRVKNESWAQSPVDAFVLAKLEEQGLNPVAPADKRTLLRRVTFDLTGLPPTPEEVESFVADRSPNAFAKVVDRLLESRHYGEHQARFWLDVARYAEDQAHTFAVVPNTSAFRYRDWVIEAFNSDMPFDRFAKLQIAADLMETGGASDFPDRAALGFFGLGAQYYKNSDAAKAVAEELDDRIDTVTRGFLGLTVSCARCHDHKFDPIPTQDYYSIAGVFSSSKLANLPLAPKDEIDRYDAAKKKVDDADKKIKEFLKTERDKLLQLKAKEVSAYFLAAWKLEAKRLEKPDTPPSVIAKEMKLDAATLDRFSKYVNRKGGANPLGDAWVRVLPQRDSAGVTPEVEKAARDAEEYVVAAVSEPAKSGGNAGAQKMRNEVMKSLFEDKGVFVITESDVVGRMDPPGREVLDGMKSEMTSLQRAMPPAPPVAHGITEGNPTDLKVAIRGNPSKPGELAPRRFLKVIAGDDPAKFTRGSGRLELAEAIADPKNPLTARVLVNRVWQQHFGRGIVGTASNFGTLGERPTHPELLDYLTSRFVESNWSVKQLHREILLSSTYQLSSAPDEKNQQLDGDNRFLWRMTRQRLRVEAFRDSLLAVAGRLEKSFGGKTTDLDQESNVRRTVYGKVSRHELCGLLRLFDFPDANITSERRTETTVPQQQLFVLNSPFCVAQAKAFSARLRSEGDDDPSRIRRAYLLAYGREASERELEIGLRFLGESDSLEEEGKNKLSRWERYAQALLAANEFQYLD